MNLAAPLQRWAHETPNQPAILFEGRAITYAGLAADSARLAHALRAHGVGAGDRVALYLPNVPEFAVAYYAAQLVGAIAVTLSVTSLLSAAVGMVNPVTVTSITSS